MAYQVMLVDGPMDGLRPVVPAGLRELQVLLPESACLDYGPIGPPGHTPRFGVYRPDPGDVKLWRWYGPSD